MSDNEQLIEKSKAAEKSLRWLANNFDAPEYSADFAGQLARCIHDYCRVGADMIKDLTGVLQKQDGTEEVTVE